MGAVEQFRAEREKQPPKGAESSRTMSAKLAGVSYSTAKHWLRGKQESGEFQSDVFLVNGQWERFYWPVEKSAGK